MLLTFAKEKETKNTVRFQEVVEDGAWPAIGSLYVAKPIVAQLEVDETLTVELKAS